LEKTAEVTLLTIRDIFGLGFPASVVGVLIVEATILTTVEVAPTMGALVFPKNLLTQDQLVLTMKTDVRHGLLLTGPARFLPLCTTSWGVRPWGVGFLFIALLADFMANASQGTASNDTSRYSLSSNPR
jgi:hypothetical protein